MPVAGGASLVPVVQRVFALVTSHRWLYDFLFSFDALADLSLLTSPLRNRLHSLSRTTTTLTERGGTHHHLLDSHRIETALTLPAFTLDNLTVGLLLRHRVTDVPCHLQPPPSFHISRFVRFNDSPVLLYVTHSTAHPSLDITIIKPVSSRRATHLDLHFAQSPFTPAPPTSSDMLLATLTSLVSTELCRPCPLCHAAPAAPSCGCIFANGHTSTDLLDLAPHPALSAPIFLGRFSGIAAHHLMATGRVALQAKLDVEHSVLRVEDDSLGEDLVHRAVTTRLVDLRGISSLLVRQSPAREAESERGCAEAAITLAARLAQMRCYAASSSSDDLPVAHLKREDMGRKERNRISAARSNMKRRRHTQELRLALVILRRKADALRDRVNQLHAERAALAASAWTHNFTQDAIFGHAS